MFEVVVPDAGGLFGREATEVGKDVKPCLSGVENLRWFYIIEVSVHLHRVFIGEQTLVVVNGRSFVWCLNLVFLFILIVLLVRPYF